MECTYCSDSATTRDHVPPKGFFPEPRSSDLITVPSCAKCNASFGHDDEYIQAVIQMRADVSNSEPGSGLLDKVLRGIDRGEAQGFKRGIFESMAEAEIYTTEGIYLGNAGVMNIDRDRLMSFVRRNIQGLFYHVYRQKIPEHFRVTPAPFLETTNERLRKFVDLVRKDNIKETGRGIFRFTWTNATDSPMTSIWLMEFYKLVPFGGIVVDTNPSCK